jgi:hypothetical protein
MHGMRDGNSKDGRVFMAALFDPATGEIAHIHRVVTFDPHSRVNQEYAEQRARELAARFHHDVTKLHSLAIDQAQIKRGCKYKVDPKTSSLVEIPLPLPSPGRSPSSPAKER